MTDCIAVIRKKDIVMVTASIEDENSYKIEDSIWPAVVVCFEI